MELKNEEIQKFADENGLSFETSKCVLLCADSFEEALEDIKNFEEPQDGEDGEELIFDEEIN